MKKFHLVCCTQSSEFERRVNEALQKHWELYGDTKLEIQDGCAYFLQAFTREETNADMVDRLKKRAAAHDEALDPVDCC